MSKKTEQIEQARLRIREAGLRATPARIAVLNLLEKERGPVSHQEATEVLEANGLDKSTIFRALQDLAEANLLRRLELGDHVWRFEYIREAHGPKDVDKGHPHLLCTDCGHITCLSDKDVKLNVAKSIGSVADILLRGQCADCSDSKD